MMIRQVRLVLVTTGIVVLLATISIVLALNPLQEQEDSGVTFKALEPVDVQKVIIRNSSDTIDITFTGEGYEVDDIPADLVDSEDFINLMANCGQVYATQTVNRNPQDLALYGLNEPTARVDILYIDESELTLLIGNTERITGDTYFSVEGDPGVYLMESERSQVFLLPKKALVEDLVTPQLILSSPLSALLDVIFVGGQLAEPVTVEATATENPAVKRAAMSFGTATHIVRGAGVYELDQTYGVEIMGALLGITANDIEGYGLSREQIMDFGFSNPTMQVVFDLKNGIDVPVEHYVLAVLEKDGVYYMTCNDRGVIYVVLEPAFLHLEYSKLLVRWFLSPLLPDIKAIEIEAAGKSYEFILTGETFDDIQVTCNGQDLDIERFRALFNLLRSAEHDGRLLQDISVAGEPLLRLTYHYKDELKQPDVMELYPGDTRRNYVKVNGVTELAMRETYLTRVQEALDILWTDNPIQTDW